MFTTILVGVDGRQGGRDALALAQALSELGGGELVAAHVQPHHGLPTPGRGLHHAAEATDADIVVVGCSHRGAVGRIVAGDTTRAVLHGAGIPVVVARPAGQAPRAGGVIGLGYDGSHESDAALAWAGQLADSAGAAVRVLCVAEPPQTLSPSVSYGINWGALKPDQEEPAKRLVAHAVERLGEGALGEAVVGIAGEELVRLSRHVDLLVVGSRGYGPVRRTLLGSTSDRLIHAAKCPVVVVPRAADRRYETARAAAAPMSSISIP